MITKNSIITICILMPFVLANHTQLFYAHNQNSNNQITEKAMEKKVTTHPLLRFLYNNTLGRVIRSGLTKKWVSSAAGLYCDRSISRIHIKPFVQAHKISVNEAQKDLNQFTTFNDFFIRTLKPEARPIDSHPYSVISPADGHVMIFEHITHTMHFPVKETVFNLEKFLNSKELAAAYKGGTIMIFRLAPWDYHRFHFPLACVPSAPTIINGRYESVNPLVYLTGVQPLTENERHVSVLKNTLCGDIIMVSVGALCVGKIIETYMPEQLYQKGDEAGYFCFGGSTMVLIFEPGAITVRHDILTRSHAAQETPIKMGMTIGSIQQNRVA